MILTAQQPAYLPWLGLFHKIALSDVYVSLDSVQFEKNSFSNRNKIKTANGPVWLTVPVSLKGHTGNTIRETEIDNSKNWQKKHFTSIYLNYKKAPFFNKYADFFEDTYIKKEWHVISELNDYMLRWFLEQLGIKIQFHQSSKLNLKGHKTELVLNMCKKLGAEIYLFGILGKDYVKEEEFIRENIRIWFQDYEHPVYPQLYGDFLSNMSIIDLLFNCGNKSLEILMSGNITKKEIKI